MSKSAITLFLVVISASLEAETIIPPPGLEPGVQYRLVITTRLLSPASSPDIEFYNEIVNRDVAESNPDLAHLDWRAVVSTSEVDARDNTGTNWIFNRVVI